jgi:hypothetical protein
MSQPQLSSFLKMPGSEVLTLTMPRWRLRGLESPRRLSSW